MGGQMVIGYHYLILYLDIILFTTIIDGLMSILFCLIIKALMFNKIDRYIIKIYYSCPYNQSRPHRHIYMTNHDRILYKMSHTIYTIQPGQNLFCTFVFVI